MCVFTSLTDSLLFWQCLRHILLGESGITFYEFPATLLIGFSFRPSSIYSALPVHFILCTSYLIILYLFTRYLFILYLLLLIWIHKLHKHFLLKSTATKWKREREKKKRERKRESATIRTTTNLKGPNSKLKRKRRIPGHVKTRITRKYRNNIILPPNLLQSQQQKIIPPVTFTCITRSVNLLPPPPFTCYFLLFSLFPCKSLLNTFISNTVLPFLSLSLLLSLSLSFSLSLFTFTSTVACPSSLSLSRTRASSVWNTDSWTQEFEFKYFFLPFCLYLFTTWLSISSFSE